MTELQNYLTGLAAGDAVYVDLQTSIQVWRDLAQVLRVTA